MLALTNEGATLRFHTYTDLAIKYEPMLRMQEIWVEVTIPEWPNRYQAVPNVSADCQFHPFRARMVREGSFLWCVQYSIRSHSLREEDYGLGANH